MFGLDLGWIVAAIAIGIAVARRAKKVDDKIEERRDLALDVATGLDKQGLEVIPEVLRAYAIGNYSEVLKKLREGAMVMTNPALAKVVFDNLFEKMFAARANTPEVRDALVKRLTAGTPVVAQITPKPGEAPVTSVK